MQSHSGHQCEHTWSSGTDWFLFYSVHVKRCSVLTSVVPHQLYSYSGYQSVTTRCRANLLGMCIQRCSVQTSVPHTRSTQVNRLIPDLPRSVFSDVQCWFHFCLQDACKTVTFWWSVQVTAVIGTSWFLVYLLCVLISVQCWSVLLTWFTADSHFLVISLDDHSVQKQTDFWPA